MRLVGGMRWVIKNGERWEVGSQNRWKMGGWPRNRWDIGS